MGLEIKSSGVISVSLLKSCIINEALLDFGKCKMDKKTSKVLEVIDTISKCPV